MATNKDSSYLANKLLQFRGESEDGQLSYVLLPDTRIEDAIEVLNVGFYPFENVSICNRVAQNPGAVKELNELVRVSIKDGVSIVAIDKLTDQVVGVSVNKIQRKSSDPKQPSFFEEFLETRCKEKESISLIELMIECDAYVNVFERYNTTEVVELTFLAVLPDYRKRNIGLELVRSTLLLTNQISVNFDGPDVVVSLFSSEYSRKIGDKLDFETLKVVPYNQLEYEGVKYSDTLPPAHTGIFFMAKGCKQLRI